MGCRGFRDNAKFSVPLLPARKQPWYGVTVRIADSPYRPAWHL